jgi:hypothetical protein
VSQVQVIAIDFSTWGLENLTAYTSKLIVGYGNFTFREQIGLRSMLPWSLVELVELFYLIGIQRLGDCKCRRLCGGGWRCRDEDATGSRLADSPGCLQPTRIPSRRMKTKHSPVCLPAQAAWKPPTHSYFVP